MTNNYSNPCPRCGKERIVSKVYEEQIGQSIVTTREMVCPDKECQNKVNMDNKRREDKNALLKLKSEQRILAKKIARETARTNTIT